MDVLLLPNLLLDIIQQPTAFGTFVAVLYDGLYYLCSKTTTVVKKSLVKPSDYCDPPVLGRLHGFRRMQNWQQMRQPPREQHSQRMQVSGNCTWDVATTVDPKKNCKWWEYGHGILWWLSRIHRKSRVTKRTSEGYQKKYTNISVVQDSHMSIFQPLSQWKILDRGQWLHRFKTTAVFSLLFHTQRWTKSRWIVIFQPGCFWNKQDVTLLERLLKGIRMTSPIFAKCSMETTESTVFSDTIWQSQWHPQFCLTLCSSFPEQKSNMQGPWFVFTKHHVIIFGEYNELAFTYRKYINLLPFNNVPH